MSEKEFDREQQPIPGIDYVVTRAQLELVDVNQALMALTSVECHEVKEHMTKLEGDRPEEQLAAIRLLFGLASYHLVPDHPIAPFKPMFTMGDRRSLVPSDLQPEQINVLAEFAPTVLHLGLRARLCDVCWFMQRNRREMAELAITAYCDLVEAVRAGRATFSFENTSAWGIGAKNALVRAARVSHATGWQLPVSQRVRDLVADLVASAHHDRRSDDFWRIAEVDLDYKATKPIEIAAMAEALVTERQMAENPDARLSLLQLAARGYRLARDAENAKRCMVAIAECYIQKADLARSAMLEAEFLQDAIQTLRNQSNTTSRRAELTNRLLTVQPRIRDEMAHFSTEIDLTKIVQCSVAAVRGHSWPVAFLSLALCDLPPTPDAIRETANEHAQKFPLQGIFAMQVHDFQGRVVFRSPGMGGDEEALEEQMRYQMAVHRGHSRQVAVAGVINPIRRTIACEHMVSSDTVLEMLRDSPFIPAGHEHVFARAICHFLAGEDIEAVSLLTPQLENSLRHILALAGHDTTTADKYGIQTEASLSILLNADKPWRGHLEQIISPRYIHEIDLLFCFSGGPSVRNQVAHGKIPDGGFRDHSFVYAAWLVIHLAILPIADQWVKVEEIFARVTGLYKTMDIDEQS